MGWFANCKVVEFVRGEIESDPLSQYTAKSHNYIWNVAQLTGAVEYTDYTTTEG